MTDDVKQAILDKHNELRNIQATGKTPGYPPAKRMATMVSIFQFFFHCYLFIRDLDITTKIHEIWTILMNFWPFHRHGTMNWLIWPCTTWFNVRWNMMCAVARGFSNTRVKISMNNTQMIRRSLVQLQLNGGMMNIHTLPSQISANSPTSKKMGEFFSLFKFFLNSVH